MPKAKSDQHSERPSPLICVFDTNAFTYLADHPDYDAIVSKIQARDRAIVPHLTFTNFFEYLRMVVDDDSLVRAQTYIKKLKPITLGGSIMPMAKLHVRSAAGLTSRSELESDVRILLHGMNEFLKLHDYEQFQKIVTPTLKTDVQRTADIVAGYEGMRAPTEAILKKFREQKKIRDFKRWLSGKAQREYLEIFVTHALTRFDLKMTEFDSDVDVLFQRLPSVKYFVFVFLHYVRQLVLNKRKPKLSDYNDLELVFYLNVADYFVSNDGFLRDLINDCGEPELKGRAISCEDFLGFMDQENLTPRAPQRASSAWIDLN